MSYRHTVEDRDYYYTVEHFAGDSPNPQSDDLEFCTAESEGYYWAYCFPGCLPDSHWYGPYKTAEDCHRAAVEDIEDHASPWNT